MSINQKKKFRKSTRWFNFSYLFVLAFIVVAILTSNHFFSPIKNPWDNKNLVPPQEIVIPSQTPKEIENQILDLINKERDKANLRPLIRNNLLDIAAKKKAENMLYENYWAHKSPKGKEPWDFVNEAGYSYSWAGENLGRGFFSGKDYLDAWMNSKEHKKNILDPNYNDTGIYVEENVYYQNEKTTIAIEEFASPKIEYGPNDPIHCPVHINCGGGTIPLKRYECENSICCQIGDKAILYLDRNKCAEDQNRNR